jgi:nucleotide sugar dehydrogenase
VNLRVCRSYETAFQEAHTFFVVVPTPSLQDNSYDHQYIESVVANIQQMGMQSQRKQLVISCTTMPEYCEGVLERLQPLNIDVCYNPEFIAQGEIVDGFRSPDLVLIGESSQDAGDIIESIYQRTCLNKPPVCRMKLIEAEITKISLNCFLTMKIAYANMIGDLVKHVGGNADVVLRAIGIDSRIGQKYLRWGYGYGGPCLPRDNLALLKYGDDKDWKLPLCGAIDATNDQHLHSMVQLIKRMHPIHEEYVFDYITYKPNTIILEQSFPLRLALLLKEHGYTVHIKESTIVIGELRKKYGDMFKYSECA